MNVGSTNRRLALSLIFMTVGLPSWTVADPKQDMSMDGMSVIGNSELPKALFIVPWKNPKATLAPERPVDSLVDEALQPVDPEVFRRKLNYFDTVHKQR